MYYGIHAIAWVPGTVGTVVFLSAPTQTTERPALFPCPDTGCVGTPSSAVSDGMGGFDKKLQVIGNQVFYTSAYQYLNVLTCSSGSCSNGTTLGVGRDRPFTSNGSTDYFIDTNTGSGGHNGYILACDLAAARPCTPTTVQASDQSAAIDIQAVGSNLYWLVVGRDGYNEGRIRQCQLPDCSTISDYASHLDSPKEMLVESDGAFIVNATNVIQRCQGSACTGGAQDWVLGQTAPHSLRSDASFVYWLDGAAIRRVAK